MVRLSNRFQLASSVATVCVLIFSLGLLTYVGFGEARRTYSTFVMDRLAAQGEIIQDNVETFLLADLPVEQFPGFITITTPLLTSDGSITSVYLSSSAGKTIFANMQPGTASDLVTASTFSTSGVQGQPGRYIVTESDTTYDVALPLKNRFEEIGALHITTPKAVITDKINPYFAGVGVLALIICAAFTVFVFRRGRRATEDTRWMTVSFSLAFVVMSVIVVFTLVNIYSEGIQSKTSALANTLSQRLNAPLALGLSFDDFDKLDQTFDDYRKLNPDISFVALTSGSTIISHTDPTLTGKTWQDDPDQYEYTVDLKNTSNGQQMAVRLGIPKSVVYSKLWRGVKNFLALFVASVLLSTLFFNLIRSINRFGRAAPTPATRRAFQLSLIGPLYFVGVFADSLTNSFLPQHFRELAVKTGIDPSAGSSLFTVYFAAYAIALIIANPLAQRRGLKSLFLFGTALTMSELLTLAFVPNFYVMILVEAMAGLGQGIIFIGAQTYILSIASATQRTRSAAIIVFGFNGGLLSAVAIGGLLAADPALGRQGVFLTGSVVALLVFVYARFCVPNTLATHDAEEAAASADTDASVPISAPVSQPVIANAGLRTRLGKALTDLRFMQTTFLIGIPTKIIMSGLITATLPLLLSRQNYQTEDIAQLIMFYSGAVLISSRIFSGLADRTGRVGLILFVGSVVSGFGLILIGLMDWTGFGGTSLPFIETGFVIAGLAALGLAHGCIQAPVITYIASTPTANILGKNSTTSLYRLFERIGNIGGPIIVSQMLLLYNGNVSAIAIIGVSVIVLGLLFAVRIPRNRVGPPSEVEAGLASAR